MNPDPVDALVLDLLEWIGTSGRPYTEVLDAWRTSCPRLPVWEECQGRGYVDILHRPDTGHVVRLSARGEARLAERRHGFDIAHMSCRHRGLL